MSRRLAWSARAARDLRQLDRQTAQRVLAALRRYAESGHGDVIRLQDVTPATWRLRVGDWRVLIRLDDPTAIDVRRVLHRREAYRD